MFTKQFTLLLVICLALFLATPAFAKMYCQAQGYCVETKSQCRGFIYDDAYGCGDKLCCIEDL